jgi:iron(III) transport system ATP-binding protein
MNTYINKKQQTEVRLEGITKVYTNPKTKCDFNAVDNIDFKINPGEFITLLGPSGCGKTTTLRMIAGFESPDKGEIYFGNQPVNALTPNKRDTAMVFQSYALLPHYNVFDNVAYGLRLRKLPRQEIKNKVLGILNLVGLEGTEGRMTNQLSGGQQQRVALARALVIEPGVLLFDEPLSNLDAKLRVSMRTEIRKIQQKVGITAIYVTHDQSEAMAISDKIVIMDKGHIMQMGTPKEIYYHPANHFVADFIGEANFITATVIETITDEDGSIYVTLDADGVALKTQSANKMNAGQKCEIVLRPEAITVSDKGILPCEITTSTFMGSHQFYQADYRGTNIKIFDYNPRSKKIFEAGDKAFISFESMNVQLLEQ